MRDYDFEDSTGYWICVTSHVYQRRLDKELAPLGITFRQFQVLGWLVFSGALSQAELAERMMVEPPTLARLLDRMQAQGWIVRSASPTDRRCKLLRVGPQAGPVWDAVVDCLTRVRREATRGMAPAEIQTLQHLLRRVQENLAPADPNEEPPAEAAHLTEPTEETA
jgi:MarR family transcriptional regulator for hemolysin